MSDRPIPRQLDPHNGFNQHRNTSRVFPVPKGAAGDAVKACQQLRARDPRLVRWLEEGHPNMTDDEHYERFGEPYGGAPTKRGKKRDD